MNLPDFSLRTPRAVALDLDETTLDSNSRLADRTRAAMHAVHDIGLPIIIATSRPERVLPHLVGDDILSIASVVQMNGTLAIGRAGLRGSVKQLINLSDARTCWAMTNEEAPWARMTVEVDGIQFVVNHSDDVDELWAFNKATPTMVIQFEDAMSADPVKISVNGLDRSLQPLMIALQQRISDDTVILGAGRLNFLNVVPRQASKSGAVATLLQGANIPLKDVLSFGDDFVDADLIRDCGWSVAVENAIPEIKALAKYSTASNDDFGVAIVLERLVSAYS